MTYRCLILHDAVPAGARPDELDTLAQCAAITAVLADAGWHVDAAAATLDLATLDARLHDDRPDLVFNLVESLAGAGRLIHLVPSLLEARGVPFTGCGAAALLLTSGKTLAKRHMRARRLPTPAWWTAQNDGAFDPGVGRWIVKSVWEHASIGIEDDAIVPGGDLGALRAAVERRAGGVMGEVFAEAFVPGREFNLTVVETTRGPRILPPAEIDFSGLPPGSEAIVGYRAKWDPASPHYHATPRRFSFPAGDAALLRRLAALCRRAWHAFALRGYARVDFRVDGDGVPWILEVNANPCLTPDAGVTAAAAQLGWTYAELVLGIVGAATGAAARA